MESDEDESVPMVAVGNDKIPLTDINEDVIARMSASEKETYIQQYQEFYAHIYD
jgi:transcription initiation factor TFIIE subunit alpha